MGNYRLFELLILFLCVRDIFCSPISSITHHHQLLHSPYASSSSFSQLQECPHTSSSEIEAMAEIVQGFQWHEIIFLHEDSESSNQFASQLVDVFRDKEIIISNKIPISSSVTYFSTLKILTKISNTQNRIILVHVTDLSLASRLVLAAKEVGLISKGYAWLITSCMFKMLNAMDQNTHNAMEGALGIRPHLQISTPNSPAQDIPRGHRCNSYEIFNVLGKVERVVSYWSPHFGFSRDLGAVDDVKYFNSVTNFKKIIWPGDSTRVPLSCDVPMDIRTRGPWRSILR